MFGLSAWVMVLLAFVPTLRVCGTPTSPYEFPPAYFIHAGSLVAGIVAFAATLHARKIAWLVLVAIWLCALGLVGVGIASEAGVGAAAITAVVALAAIGTATSHLARTRGLGERPVLYGLLAHALTCFGWYALLAADRDAMIGAYLGAGVGAVMVLAAVIAVIAHEHDMLQERRANRPAALPVARILR